MLCIFLEILSRNSTKYNSGDIDCYVLPHMCYYIDGEVPADEAPELTSSELSPRSCVNYLQEKAGRLRARLGDLEAAEAELECQRQDFVRQQAA